MANAHRHTPAAPTTALSDLQSDGVITRLDTFKHMPTISERVSHLLEAYEEQAKTAVQGMHPRKLWRYNSVDPIQTPHELCWPNEDNNPRQVKKGKL